MITVLQSNGQRCQLVILKLTLDMKCGPASVVDCTLHLDGYVYVSVEAQGTPGREQSPACSTHVNKYISILSARFLSQPRHSDLYFSERIRRALMSELVHYFVNRFTSQG